MTDFSKLTGSVFLKVPLSTLLARALDTEDRFAGDRVINYRPTRFVRAYGSRQRLTNHERNRRRHGEH